MKRNRKIGTTEPILRNITQTTVRFSEVDSMQVVWHGEYVRYFEDGREAFGRQFTGIGYLDFYAEGYTAPIVEKGMNSYFRGQALIALIVGILFAIGFKIINLPLGITFGLFVGVLNLVPYLQTISLIPAVLLSIIKAAEYNQNFLLVLLSVALVYVVVQAIQELFLNPNILSKATGLKPAIILLSLSIFGSLLGLVGMIIALPSTSLIISYYKRFVIRREPITKRVDESFETDQSLETDNKPGTKAKAKPEKNK
jgi:hypothetical protein